MMAEATDNSKDVGCYLERPYARIVLPESDGTFRGEILEFPGCISTGDTAVEALTSLEEVAASWLDAALANGQSIPDPIESNEFSGRLVLRLPKSLHKKSARLAERDGVSLNQFIVASLAEHVGERVAMQTIRIRLDAIHNVRNIWSSWSQNIIGARDHYVQALQYTPAPNVDIRAVADLTPWKRISNA